MEIEECFLFICGSRWDKFDKINIIVQRVKVRDISVIDYIASFRDKKIWGLVEKFEN